MDYDQILSNSVCKINSGRRGGRTLFQSKIVRTKEQKRQIFNNNEHDQLGSRAKRQVLRKDAAVNSTWTNGVYTFNTSHNAVKNLFKMGAKIWNDATCVDFLEDRDAQDKVVVVVDSVSYADVGRLGGDQPLSVAERQATVGSAVHEIGHILGLFHTMSRYDRDDYITINEYNVDVGCFENEFEILQEDCIDVYGLTYDYGSIMHYGELSFSSNQRPTIVAEDPHYQKTMGSQLISFSDIYMINEHYGCNQKCNKSTSAKCVNEGYPHPRNCSRCICPGGYGGTLCDRRPPGCGEDLTATNVNQTVFYRLGFGSGFRSLFDFCNYMISAPRGKKIEVEVQPISSVYNIPGCGRGGVEVKAQEDQKLTGYRFCTSRGNGIPIVSNSNRLPVIVFNRFGTMNGAFTYRFIN
ncbi:hypothetical protein Angca_010294 [Angiostrongylus cantonensis]|nr:hypothetical protein Angca_010294 [Angiostrongylus cantonensis]